MAGPVFYDAVAEWSLTSGTDRPYALAGAVPGFRRAAEAVADQDWGYWRITDEVRTEFIEGRLLAPDHLDVIRVLVSTVEGGGAVSWPAGGRRIVELVSSAVVSEGVSSNLLTSLASEFWLRLEYGGIDDLGLLSGEILELIESGMLADGVSGTVDLGTLTSLIQEAMAAADEFWLRLEYGGIDDLGVLSEEILELIDAGGLGPGNTLSTIDLGLLSTIIAQTNDDDVFWMLLEVGGVTDLGRLSDQAIRVVESGSLASMDADGLIDLGRLE